MFPNPVFDVNLSLFSTVAPIVMDFDLDAIGALRDRQVGALIVRDPESMVEVSVTVEGDPCPAAFQWSFNGTNINDEDVYRITNPCTADASSPFTYMLTIRNLTAARSGVYSATFENLDGMDTLPGLYITVPGMSTVHVNYWEYLYSSHLHRVC